MVQIKKISIFLMALILICCTLCFTGCGEKEEPEPPKPVQFGEFGYNDIYLTEFATQSILPSKAKQIITDNLDKNISYNSTTFSTASDGYTQDPIPDTDTINFILTRFSGCEIYTKYYVNGSDEQQTKLDSIQGTDFKNMLTSNQFTSFSQLVAKYIVCFPTLIDTMEIRNQEFKGSDNYMVAPFADIFTYHTSAKGELVIQTRDFAEIPSSVGGGIGCSYRQDTEILYDNQNKIQKWQTSLGLYSATPEGTMKQGYILEVEFNWISKI